MAGQYEGLPLETGARAPARIPCDFVPTERSEGGRARRPLELDPLALGPVTLSAGSALPARDLLAESLGEALREAVNRAVPGLTLGEPAAAAAGADAFTRGLAKAAAGDHQGAVAEFTAALARDPRNGRIYLERGYSYRG